MVRGTGITVELLYRETIPSAGGTTLDLSIGRQVVWRSSQIGWWLGQKWPCQRKWLRRLNRCSVLEGLDQCPGLYGFLSFVRPVDKTVSDKHKSSSIVTIKCFYFSSVNVLP